MAQDALHLRARDDSQDGIGGRIDLNDDPDVSHADPKPSVLSAKLLYGWGTRQRAPAQPVQRGQYGPLVILRKTPEIPERSWGEPKFPGHSETEPAPDVLQGQPPF